MLDSDRLFALNWQKKFALNHYAVYLGIMINSRARDCHADPRYNLHKVPLPTLMKCKLFYKNN